MNDSVELWKKHPYIDKLEISTLGRVRSVKGHYYTIIPGSGGYLTVGFRMNGKKVHKLVHRLVAETFIPNQDNLPEVNHLDCNRKNNIVENLEWVTRKENIAYRDKLGHTAKNNAPKSPVFAISLKTFEVSRFQSQNEASQKLGVDPSSIGRMLNGKQKQAGGYWFKEDDGNGIEIDKDKLNDIVDGMNFTGGVFAVNLNTLEVSWFHSRHEASLALGVFQTKISAVTKGRYSQTHGFWFVNDDNNAANNIKQKLHEIKYRAVN